MEIIKMYTQNVTAKVIGKTEEPRFLGGKKYKVAYETIDGPKRIRGSMNVNFTEFCEYNLGDRFQMEVYSADGIVWTDSPAKLTLDTVLGVFIHPSMRE
jgi:hypothetical protein